MKKPSSHIKNNDYTSSRVVLVEKSNRRLDLIMGFITRTKFLSTEVIPLSKEEKKYIGTSFKENKNIVLVYQESKKLSSIIFRKKSSNIIIARIIILQIILNESSEIFHNVYNINPLINKSHYNQLFVSGNQFSFSMLLAIPASAKHEFIKSCLNYDLLDRNGLCMESFPVFKFPGYFSQNKLEDGTFLEELNPKFKALSYTTAGKLLSMSHREELDIFKTYVSMYNKGMWGEMNKENNLNRELNEL